MAAMTVSGNVEKALTQIAELAGRLGDLSPVTETMAADMYTDIIIESFDSRTSPIGQRWAPLKPATLERKAKQGYGPAPLVRTGHLRNSLFTRGESNRVVFGGMGGEAVTNDGKRYGLFHQFGTFDVPQRAFLPVHESGAIEASGRMREWLSEFRKVTQRYIKTGSVA